MLLIAGPLRDGMVDEEQRALTPTRVEGWQVPETPWDATLSEVVAAFSTNRGYRPFDLVDGLERRSLFREQGRHVTAPIVFTQLLDAYVASFHARNGFSRDRMTPNAAAGFGRTVADLVRSSTTDRYAELQITGQVTWGLPAPG